LLAGSSRAASTSFPVGQRGMNTSCLKTIPKNSPSAGAAATVAFVSGPRTVRLVLPFSFVTTISQWLTATDVNSSARSICVCQMLCTNRESEGLSSRSNAMREAKNA